MQKYTRGGQRSACGSHFSLSNMMSFRPQTGVTRLVDKCLYPLSHFSGSLFDSFLIISLTPCHFLPLLLLFIDESLTPPLLLVLTVSFAQVSLGADVITGQGPLPHLI